MKTRNGFVSNSSTTSFMLCGVALEPDEVAKMLKWDHPDIKALIAKWESKDEPLDILDYVLKGLHSEQSEWGDHRYFGLSWSAVKDDETGAQFKERIRAALAEYLDGDLTLGTHEEAWYNG